MEDPHFVPRGPCDSVHHPCELNSPAPTVCTFLTFFSSWMKQTSSLITSLFLRLPESSSRQALQLHSSEISVMVMPSRSHSVTMSGKRLAQRHRGSFWPPSVGLPLLRTLHPQRPAKLSSISSLRTPRSYRSSWNSSTARAPHTALSPMTSWAQQSRISSST